MSKHGPRCVHCAQYHGADETVCPWTRKPLPQSGASPLPAHAAVTPSTGGASAKSEDEGRALIGQTLAGKYFVRSVLGRGGMGTVYEGVNIQMGRVVALKVLHPRQVKKNESVKRFHQEARAAGAIGHPNICEVYDLGTLDDGSPYLVMERLVGTTLSNYAKESVLPFDAALDIMIQVLSGLVVAHEKGIVHRDLKPDNIFLSERVGCPPVAKVLDFGVSKVVSGEPSQPRDADLDLTRTGMVMGTPYYMSPEQASGARDLDGRVDLYACGVILYETLTGRRPFLAPNYHILLWNILKTEPPAPSELRPDIPPPLEAVIARAMARDRAVRYQSAHEFIAALSHVRMNLGQYTAASPPRRDIAVPSAAPAPPVPPPPPPAPSAAGPLAPSPATGAAVLRRPTAEVPSGGHVAAPPRPESEEIRASGSRRVRVHGFDEVSTEIDGLKDFSLSGDEHDATTTLMEDEDVARIAKSAREAAKRAKKKAEPFDPNKTEISKSPPPRIVDNYADETVRMDRPETSPSTERAPKRR